MTTVPVIDKPRIQILIALIRCSHPDMKEIFTKGSCWSMFLILKEIWPSSIAYYDRTGGHIITRIGESFYDICGLIEEHKIPENLIRLPHPDFRPWEWKEKLSTSEKGNKK